MENVTELPCGCRRGHFLCPKAEALWAQVNSAYKDWQSHPTNAHWLEYEKAHADYDAHFKAAVRK